MKVKIEIEFDMETKLNESDIEKTKKELLGGIRLKQSDDVDGFVITTDFADCNNTEDFFIKSNSAKIVAIKTPEFSKEELSVIDIDINDDYDGVSCQFASIYNADEKFGTHFNDEDDSWVNFYAEYLPESKELKCEYYLCTPLIEESCPYTPTEEEKQLIIFAMEEYTQDNYGENIMEFVAREREDAEFEENISIGSM